MPGQGQVRLGTFRRCVTRHKVAANGSEVGHKLQTGVRTAWLGAKKQWENWNTPGPGPDPARAKTRPAPGLEGRQSQVQEPGSGGPNQGARARARVRAESRVRARDLCGQLRVWGNIVTTADSACACLEGQPGGQLGRPPGAPSQGLTERSTSARLPQKTREWGGGRV